MRGLSIQEREIISIFSANEAVAVDANDIIEIRSISKEAANQIHCTNRHFCQAGLQRSIGT